MTSLFTKRKKFLSIAIVLVFVICLFVAEAGIRIYHLTRHRQRFIWIPDPFLGYIHTPQNCFTHIFTEEKKYFIDHQTNSLGLIGKEISIQKPEETFRIIVLGDSYTEAIQVTEDKNFCARLKTLLAPYLPAKYRSIEVLNAGVSGYSPIVEYLYFKRKLARLDPDLVVVQLFSNDIFEDNVALAKSIINEEGLPLKIAKYFSEKSFSPNVRQTEQFESFPLSYRVNSFLLNKSRLWEYFYVKIVSRGKKSRAHREMTSLKKYDMGYQFFILDPNHFLTLDEDFREGTWHNTQKYLLALKDLVEKEGVKFFIFYIPMEAQLKLDQYGEHAKLYVWQHVGQYFNRLLEKFTRENNVSYLDLWPVFEENKHKNLYWNRDGHLTEEGHEITAQAVAKYLRDNPFLLQGR